MEKRSNGIVTWSTNVIRPSIDNLFHMHRINKCRPKHHQFRFSLQTDGYTTKLSFVKFLEVPKKELQEETQPRKRAKQLKKLIDLKPGLAYSDNYKYLERLDDLKDYDMITLDPGINRIYTALELLTSDVDVRKTKIVLKGKSWRNRTRQQFFTQLQQKWHRKELGEIQEELNRVPYRTTCNPELFDEYVQAIFHHWQALWRFAAMPKIRNLKFRAKRIYQKELDREADRLTRREDGKRVILIIGNAGKRTKFGKLKGNLKGPINGLVKRILERKLAIVIWADEFRSSMLGIHGYKVVHPEE